MLCCDLRQLHSSCCFDKNPNHRTAAPQKEKARDFVTCTVLLKQCGQMPGQHRPLPSPPHPPSRACSRSLSDCRVCSLVKKVKPSGLCTGVCKSRCPSRGKPLATAEIYLCQQPLEYTMYTGTITTKSHCAHGQCSMGSVTRMWHVLSQT